MRRVLAVIERDMRKFRRNPVIMATAIVFPLFYLVILGNSFQGTLKGLSLAVVNQDDGPRGRRVDEVLHALEAGPGTVRLVPLADPGEAVEGVRAGRFKGALVVPPDFSRKTELRTGPEVGLFLDNTDGISSRSLAAAVEAAIAGLPAEYVPIRADRAPVRLRPVELYRQIDYDQTLVPGVVVMAIFLGTMFTGVVNLVMDRFLGSDEAILLTPVTKTDMVVGLVTSGFLITLLLASIVLGLSALMTRLPLELTPERILGILAVLALTTLGLLAMMFTVLGRATHPRIIGLLSGFMNVILFFPSGAVYPVESFPRWLRAFASVNPEYYAVHALRSVLMKGTPVAAVAGDLSFLAAFAAVMMVLAVVTFKRTL